MEEKAKKCCYRFCLQHQEIKTAASIYIFCRLLLANLLSIILNLNNGVKNTPYSKMATILVSFCLLAN